MKENYIEEHLNKLYKWKSSNLVGYAHEFWRDGLMSLQGHSWFWKLEKKENVKWQESLGAMGLMLIPEKVMEQIIQGTVSEHEGQKGDQES